MTVDAWTSRPLGELAVVKWGDTSTTKAAYVEEGFRAFSASGPDGFLDHYDFACDGIVLSAIGAKCGGTWFARGRWSAIKNTIVITNPSKEVDIRFLFYATSNPDIWPKRGAAQPFISQTDARKIKIRVPPLEVQKRIASILSAYDDLIENNTRRIAILEEMARRLYEECFVQLRFPGLKASRGQNGLPKGWHSYALDQIAADVRHTIAPREVAPETPYVGLEHLPRRSLTLRDWANAESVDSTKLKFEENDILFGKIRPYFHKVVLAPTDGIASSDTIVIRPKQKKYLALAACCVSSDAFVAYAVQTSNGTKMPRADWKVLQKYEIIVPPDDILERFNRSALPLFEGLKVLTKQAQNLREQRDLLLPKLVSGGIDVAAAEEAIEEAAA